MKRISFIGSGNVSTHLAIALSKVGYTIHQIYSPTYKHALSLATKVGAQVVNSCEELDEDIDICIVSVPDHSIENVVELIQGKNFLCVHTSGSVSMDVFKNRILKYGVFYPLQTFSKAREMDLYNVPVCIESNTSEDKLMLQEMAQAIHTKVYQLDSEQRKEIHLAAVFACNFTNHMFSIAHRLLDSKDIPFEIIKPLIQETADKIRDHRPVDVQTGPAIRNDIQTIHKHMNILNQNNPDLSLLYKLLSDSIINFNKEK
ncbi:MAG: DUF2520 domain-containing protein [Bacteroidales bacterium]|nr:DUF2520 domain-containing protein [Bacteroidales bacterium]